MSNLTPQVRVNKNGIPVIKHVLDEPIKAPVSAAKAIPAPARTPDPVGVRETLPALKGKVLKEAKELARMAQNGDQRYEDTMTAHMLDNDIRSMRILNGLTDGGSYSNTDFFMNIIETRKRLGLGADEDVNTFIAKCEMLSEVCDTGPILGEDFFDNAKSEEGDKYIRFMEDNYDRVDEIVKLHQERELHSLTLAEFKAIWDEVSNAPVGALKDGAL